MSYLTQKDLFLAGRREAIIQPTRFDKAIIDTEGSDVNVVLNASATMGEEVVRYLVTRLNAKTLSNSRGEDTDRVIMDLYNLPRQTAQAAVVELQLTRTSTTGLTIPRNSQFGSESGVTFSTQTDVSFPLNNLGPLYVYASADRTGSDGNVGADTVTRPLGGFSDSTVLVTNPDPAAGGIEAQEDDDYKSDARDFFINARRGTKTAIEFGARQANGVFQASAIEDLNSDGIEIGRVQLYITDQDGQANTALAELVEEELDEYRALGVPVSIVPSVPQYIDVIVVGLQFEAGVNTSQVLETASASVLSAVNSLRPGETLRRASIFAALDRVDGLIVPDGSVTEPAGDIVPSTGTTIKTTTEMIQLSG